MSGYRLPWSIRSDMSLPPLVSEEDMDEGKLVDIPVTGAYELRGIYHQLRPQTLQQSLPVSGNLTQPPLTYFENAVSRLGYGVESRHVMKNIVERGSILDQHQYIGYPQQNQNSAESVRSVLVHPARNLHELDHHRNGFISQGQMSSNVFSQQNQRHATPTFLGYKRPLDNTFNDRADAQTAALGSPNDFLYRHLQNCRSDSCDICFRIKSTFYKQRHQQPPPKRARIHPVQSGTTPSLSVLNITENSQGFLSVCQRIDTSIISDIEAKYCTSYFPESEVTSYGTDVNQPDVHEVSARVEPSIAPVQPQLVISQCKQEMTQKKTEDHRVELNGKSEATSSNIVSDSSRKLKMSGVTIIDSFTPQQIKEHIVSLRISINQCKVGMKRNRAMEDKIDENLCSLCMNESLLFKLQPRFCASCSLQISPKGVFYSVESTATTINGLNEDKSVCKKCYKLCQTFKIAGEDIPKSSLKKKKDYGITDVECEPWVQCDRCNAWQHQICSLFNERKHKAKQTEYICPTCLLDGIRNGEQLLSQTTVLGAKDLPTTRLSDHVEEWLAQHLNNERQERAHSLGKSFEEVPGAKDLFVRVVSSVKKTVEVKQLFRKNFQEEDYSSELPYKSKAILLFQKIEGADICLFAMYVQEFGSECPQPNTRRVSISYIDSIKYFRPEIKTASGESLRTFVYHHVLLGYLSYCKMCGFTSCYIWVCPPLKRDDYILYCHPETQKMPKLDKLRQWYHAMIRKAEEEKIVVGRSNLYDDFFIPTKECNAKITATRLPYFDNDYWPEEAEVILQNVENESTTNSSSTRRVLKAARRDTTQATPGDQKDAILMHKLGEIIRPMKENFIMIHLQHFCSQCCEAILSGKVWSCNLCKSFQICERCHDNEMSLNKQDRHPINSKEEHSFYMVEVGKVPLNTDDKDSTMASDIFETRLAFLNFCQENHYEFGTLRRAKHSSLMVLYLLHTSKCNVCNITIEPAEGFHCLTCHAYNVCDSCHLKEGVAPHDHPLTSRSFICRLLSQSREMQQKSYLLILANHLVIAGNCLDLHCSHHYCRYFGNLIKHANQCETRPSGGCRDCSLLWFLMQHHVKQCKAPNCRIPSCRRWKSRMEQKRINDAQHAFPGKIVVID